MFTPANLGRYRTVVFLSPSGDILNSAQSQALQQFIENGGGFAGIHNANADTLDNLGLVRQADRRPLCLGIDTQPLTLTIVDPTHISTQGLPNPWNFTDEAYNYDVNPKVNGARVLINLDDTTVSGGTMGADHPFSLVPPL